MFKQRLLQPRRARYALGIVLGTVVAAVAGVGICAHDKYTLEVPNGLPFCDFRGYEDWQWYWRTNIRPVNSKVRSPLPIPSAIGPLGLDYMDPADDPRTRL
jgi:hypothetical protein